MLKKDNIIIKISPPSRLFSLFFLVASFIIAKSIYLVLFISTLILIFTIVTLVELNSLVKILKKFIFILLIFTIIYIIIFRGNNVLQLAVALYKIIFILLLVKVFDINTNFNEFHEAIYSFLLPFKIFDIEKISFNICLFLKFIKFFIESEDKLKEIQTKKGKKYFSLYKMILFRYTYALNKLKKFDLKLKLNFYKLKYKKCDFRSKMIIIISILFFMICIYKEVIL